MPQTFDRVSTEQLDVSRADGLRVGGFLPAITPMVLPITTTPPWYTARPFYPFGKATIGPGSAVVAASNPAGQIRLMPFLMGKKATLDALGITVTTAGTAAARCRVGIYTSDSSGIPTDLLVDSGELSAAAIADVIATGLSLVLTPGVLYWAAINGNEAAIQVRGYANNEGWAAGLLGQRPDQLSANPITFLIASQVYGPLVNPIAGIQQNTSSGTAPTIFGRFSP